MNKDKLKLRNKIYKDKYKHGTVISRMNSILQVVSFKN